MAGVTALLGVDGLLLGIVKLVLSARLDTTNCDLCCHWKISFNEQLYTLISRMMFRPCSFAGSKLCYNVHSGIRSRDAAVSYRSYCSHMISNGLDP